MRSRLVTLLIAAGCGAAPRPAAAGWKTEDIDARRGFHDVAMAFTPGGQPAMAYGSDATYYREWDGSAWTVEAVDGCYGVSAVYDTLYEYHDSEPALAFDPAGQPAVVSYAWDELRIRLARRGPSGWSVESLVQRFQEAKSFSLVFDGGGEPTFSFYDGHEQDLVFAHRVGGSWQLDLVDTQDWVGADSSLAYDRAGNPAIAYHDLTRQWLKLARFNGATWDILVVDDTASVGAFCSLAFDPAGNPAVSYQDTLAKNLRFASWNGAGFDIEVVDTGSWTGSHTSLAFTPAGEPAISYGSSDAIWVATRAASGWTRDRVRRVIGAGDTALAFDADGLPAVAYSDRVSNDLYLARGGASWSSELLEHGGLVGTGSSLALDAAGLPAVAYLERLTWHWGLRFARFDGTSWQSEPIEAAPDFSRGQVSSTAFALDGEPAVSYDTWGMGIRLARHGPGGWSIDVVDDGVYATAPSLAFDPAGNPAVGYRLPELGKGVVLATWNGAGWDKEQVYADGSGVSLAFDPDGRPALAYITRIGDVRVARRDGGGWRSETIARHPEARFTSIAFDPQGCLALAYEGGADGLRYAACDGSGWRIEEPDPGTYAFHPSLEFDPGGNPVIGYFRWVLGETRVVRRQGSAWQVEVVDSGGAGQFSSLAFDAGGSAYLSYGTECGDLRLARLPGDQLHRGTVPDFDPAWQAGNLPLTSINDDPTPPFPIAATSLRAARDDLATAAPLVLYRLLRPGDLDAGNRLRAVKDSGGVVISY